jgi:hypothetical protein
MMSRELEMAAAKTADELEASGGKSGRKIAALAAAVIGVAVAAGVYIAAVDQLEAHHAGRPVFFAATLVYGAVILGLAWVVVRIIKPFREMSAVQRRYQRRIFVCEVLYVLGLIAAMTCSDLVPHGSPLAWLLALAPALPAVATVVVMAIYMGEETDELKRRIAAEAALWATGGLLAVSVTAGFLEQFGLIPHTPAWAAYIVWALFLIPATLIVRRRYA